ncbi:DHHC palmitoyltransferase-domain-containing protein [Suillus fuscotomentosus]|uniref:Palmitoyltransferase n=1 Tax=Suillus fuscotomentosus TaxID=1912939 RepID=A0AAD4DY49_9AGAM|nr:DHHC palmitoyltransferase-domain-containing protein [Suillus fuscotomentosus]KAG1896241.1 DHHC palmitoyltransferase-domain-containing protein [Suillus fuscotomentosus]
MSSSDRTCCGVVEEARTRARNRRANKPQPWITLKFAVGLTLALIAYTSYVYVGIFCKDMIVKNENALGSLTTGIVFLVIFSFLLLVTLWSYFAVVITSPGYPADFIEKTELERPGQPPAHAQQPATFNDTRGMSFELMSPAVDVSNHGSALSNSGNNVPVTHPAVPAATKQDRVYHPTLHYQGTSTPGEARIVDVLVPANHESVHVSGPAPHPPHENFGDPNLDASSAMFARRPSTTPVLTPEYRFCNRDRIIKPPRTHHCRACGTCVLKYDHHCPWVGHCVGAYNHKFFVNFVQWASILSFWMFATVLGLNIRSRTRPSAPALNPQYIVLLAQTALFGLFCFLMFLTQLQLIMLNQTTVESLGFRSMQEREQDNLAHMHRWYQYGAKKRTRRRWDKEWGRIGKEGNLWWLGSRRANWESVMGKNVWWWFLPVGHGLDDGMNFPTNPRFDKEGRWRRRREWPSDLQ